MEGGAARQQAAPEPGRACLPVQGFEALHQLLQTPIGINVKVEKGHAPAAGSSGSQEAWMLCFLNSSLHGVHDAATFLFGDTERAAQALPLLGSCALAPYSLPPDLLASKAPFSLTASTTSRRLLKHARHGSDAATAPQFSLGTGGSEACVAVLERLGISQTSLWDRPRLLVELHLPDLEKAVVLLVPCDRRLLLGSSSSGDGSMGAGGEHQGSVAEAQKHLGRLQEARLRQLKRKVEAARQENKVLKQAFHEEVDFQRASRKTEELRGRLAELAAHEAALDGQLCYGLPPGWPGAAAAAAPASGVTSGAGVATGGGGAGFAWEGEWRTGTEVVYTTTDIPAFQVFNVTHASRPVCLQLDTSGGRYVLKRALEESRNPQRRLAELHSDAEAAAISRAVTDAFTSKFGKRCGKVSYVAVSVAILEDPGSPGGKAAYIKEPWIAPRDKGTSGAWDKWTRNDGRIFPGKGNATMQALTHFSLHFLRPRLRCNALVLDAQGIQGQMGSRQVFTLTDAAIASQDGRYGRADLGATAIAAFFSAHTCSDVCRRLARCSAGGGAEGSG
ncbi:alpha- kinase vwkA-like [Chlorella sorokiniana]|uniref:Alpha-kinase vwkA-like n=1 Tax=Chlorella sorokiniana TaxID=3076 RepID=A0A2P6TW71_CHLSO|nr:alpha- kinase vwkA-like [Chlorella sorokiniana]|eukprot:PRW58309.1 alpha- kinase vwkA-like [Chlorella sorokiniana]